MNFDLDPPLKKGEIKRKVPLIKGDLGGSMTSQKTSQYQQTTNGGFCPIQPFNRLFTVK